MLTQDVNALDRYKVWRKLLSSVRTIKWNRQKTVLLFWAHQLYYLSHFTRRCPSSFIPVCVYRPTVAQSFDRGKAEPMKISTVAYEGRQDTLGALHIYAPHGCSLRIRPNVVFAVNGCSRIALKFSFSLIRYLSMTYFFSLSLQCESRVS